MPRVSGVARGLRDDPAERLGTAGGDQTRHPQGAQTGGGQPGVARVARRRPPREVPWAGWRPNSATSRPPRRQRHLLCDRRLGKASQPPHECVWCAHADGPRRRQSTLARPPQSTLVAQHEFHRLSGSRRCHHMFGGWQLLGAYPRQIRMRRCWDVVQPDLPSMV